MQAGLKKQPRCNDATFTSRNKKAKEREWQTVLVTADDLKCPIVQQASSINDKRMHGNLIWRKIRK